MTEAGYTEGEQEYNIWYGKHLGEHGKHGRGKDPAPTRCVVHKSPFFSPFMSIASVLTSLNLCQNASILRTPPAAPP